MSHEKQIIVTSANKAVNLTKVKGGLNLEKVRLYSLQYYYLDFTEGNPLLTTENALFKDALFKLKYKYPKEICNYKELVGFIPTIPVANIAPVVIDIEIDLGGNDDYDFTFADFNAAFSDADGDLPNTVKITKSDSPDFDLYFSSDLVTASIFEVPFNQIAKLAVVRTNFNIFTADVAAAFRISDSSDYSNSADILVEATSATGEGNLPATIGDAALSVQNRVTTVLTLAMFTSGLTPPYNDPEADLIDAIRVDEVSTANSGEFQFNAVAVSEGQIITREDLIEELFTHIGPDVITVETDAINFSARDEGSLIWVQ